MSIALHDPALLKTRCLVGGQWVGEPVIPVTDPASGAELGRVPAIDGPGTASAIAAARAALPEWRAKTAGERARILHRWNELILANQDDLAMIMTREQGKPLAESRGEILYAASFIEWFAEEAKRMYGEVIPSHRTDSRIVVIKQPIGVVAAITPWNFPAAMITRKAGPALAAGCTMVVKPASHTPFSALALAELAVRAGVPAGVLNVITGRASVIGDELTANPVVRKLSFTGSTEVGRKLMAQSAPTIKKLSMELGGNAPFIVFDDADLDAAVEGAMASKYRNSGQTCVCANRLYVAQSVADAFEAKLKAAVAGLKVGPGTGEGVTQGPLIDEAAARKVEAHIADALAKGARLVAGGERHPLGGTFFTPTILSGCTADMAVAHEESFGPLAPIFRFATEAEAVALANATEFGLAAYIYTRDLARAWRVGEAIEAGMVGINSGMVSTAVAPFGGVKQSGLGREGSHHGIDDYVEIKYLLMSGIGPAVEGKG